MRNVMILLIVASMLALPAWAQDTAREGPLQNVVLFG